MNQKIEKVVDKFKRGTKFLTFQTCLIIILFMIALALVKIAWSGLEIKTDRVDVDIDNSGKRGFHVEVEEYHKYGF